MGRSAAVLACAAAGAGAIPAVADASSARFVAYVEGRQVTTWDMPRHQLGSADCKGALFSTAHGTETVTFRTKPARLLAYRPNPQAGVALLYGTWNRFAAGRAALQGAGTITRAHTETQEYEPGPCGAPPPAPPKPNDCGTQRWKPQVRLRWDGNTVSVDADEPKLRFALCTVHSASGVHDGDFTEGVGQRYPARDLFDRSQGLVEVLGRKTLREQLRFGTTTTTITWKLRLRRAR